MPQKPLKKAAANKKAPAANRHGKISKTKKGEGPAAVMSTKMLFYI